MQNIKEVELGAVCGRFQVFHNDHLKYILNAKKFCTHLMVGITSSDPSMALPEESDRNRGRLSANPCTYYERMLIIEKSLYEAGVSLNDFNIIPFPIGKPELVKYYLPVTATCFFTVYDKWGLEKVRRMKDTGYPVEVLWKSNNKGLSSSFIRQKIADGIDWRPFVPPASYKYITENGIDKRIISLINQEQMGEV